MLPPLKQEAEWPRRTRLACSGGDERPRVGRQNWRAEHSALVWKVEVALKEEQKWP